MEDIRSEFSDFFSYLDTGKVEIDYNPKFREFFLNCTGGDSGIVLKFCPWSGKAFPAPLRDKWFDLIDQLGVEPFSDEVPSEFMTDNWWIKRQL